jgi:hypothetical protein
MIRFVLALALLAPLSLSADPLAVTMWSPQQTLRPGLTAPVTVTLANTLTPKPDVVVSCAAMWTDTYGAEHMTFGDPLTLEVIQPITVRTFALTIPAGCEYVVGSGLVDGVAQEPVPLSGEWVWSLQRELAEQQSISLQYSVRAL